MGKPITVFTDGVEEPEMVVQTDVGYVRTMDVKRAYLEDFVIFRGKVVELPDHGKHQVATKIFARCMSIELVMNRAVSEYHKRAKKHDMF